MNFDAAEDFVWRNARLIDRLRFQFHFRGGSADAVVAALRPYRNGDGGFGNGLEPDIRDPSRQPIPTWEAFKLLDEIGAFVDQIELVHDACNFLLSVTTEEGGVPFVLPSVLDCPHAPWWQPSPKASLNPTSCLAYLLRKNGVSHRWLDRAVEYCRRRIPIERTDGGDGSDGVIAILQFLGDDPLMDDIGAEAIAKGHFVLDPNTPGYVKMPLDVAPAPDSPTRRLFSNDVIEAHLDALAARQQDDGGWPITWEPPGPAPVYEWRGQWTVRNLLILRAYGRL